MSGRCCGRVVPSESRTRVADAPGETRGKQGPDGALIEWERYKRIMRQQAPAILQLMLTSFRCCHYMQVPLACSRPAHLRHTPLLPHHHVTCVASPPTRPLLPAGNYSQQNKRARDAVADASSLSALVVVSLPPLPSLTCPCTCARPSTSPGSCATPTTFFSRSST